MSLPPLRSPALAALALVLAGCAVHVRKAPSGWLIVPQRAAACYVIPGPVLLHVMDQEDVQAAWEARGHREIVYGFTTYRECWITRDPAQPDLPWFWILAHEATHCSALDVAMPCSPDYEGVAWER